MTRTIKELMLYRIIKSIFLIWIISFLLVEMAIILGGSSDESKKVDYALILGAGIDGERLSLTLYDRMNKGLEYLSNNPEAKVIVAGGQGPGEDITEAEAMRKFLVNKGINQSRIIKEDRSTSTMENIKFTKEILKSIDDRETYEIMIITNRFHLFRAKLLAKRNGLIPYGSPSSTRWYLLPKYYIREYFAVIKSLILDI